MAYVILAVRCVGMLRIVMSILLMKLIPIFRIGVVVIVRYVFMLDINIVLMIM